MAIWLHLRTKKDVGPVRCLILCKTKQKTCRLNSKYTQCDAWMVPFSMRVSLVKPDQSELWHKQEKQSPVIVVFLANRVHTVGTNAWCLKFWSGLSGKCIDRVWWWTKELYGRMSVGTASKCVGLLLMIWSCTGQNIHMVLLFFFAPLYISYFEFSDKLPLWREELTFQPFHPSPAWTHQPQLRFHLLVFMHKRRVMGKHRIMQIETLICIKKFTRSLEMVLDSCKLWQRSLKSETFVK